MSEKFGADYYASNLPPGKSSTKGLGRTAPNQGQYFGDVWVPNGVGTPTGVNHVIFNIFRLLYFTMNSLFTMQPKSN